MDPSIAIDFFSQPFPEYIYRSTRERVDCKGWYGRWRLHLTGAYPQQPRPLSE